MCRTLFFVYHSRPCNTRILAFVCSSQRSVVVALIFNFLFGEYPFRPSLIRPEIGTVFFLTIDVVAIYLWHYFPKFSSILRSN